MTYLAKEILIFQCITWAFRTNSGVMSLLDNQKSEFTTQLHENSVADLTQNFYPGNPERKILESNRERQESNHERQKVKSTEKKKPLEKYLKVFRHSLLDNHYNTKTKDSNSSELS